jgi:hypothetical protein
MEGGNGEDRGGAEGLTGGPRPQFRAARIQIEFKNSSNGLKFCPNFDRIKSCLPMPEKLEIKYGWKELKIGNNFPYRNVSRFEM